MAIYTIDPLRDPLSLFSEQHVLRVALTNRFLVYTGTISYGLYLLHKIPFDMAHVRLERYPALVLPILLAAAYAMAALSWTPLDPSGATALAV